MSETIADKYEVLTEAGSDSVAKCYQCVAVDRAGGNVTVKRLYDEVFENTGAVNRIRNSVMRFALPLHQNVSRVLDFVVQPNEAFYLVESFVAEDLYDWCESPRPINEILPVLLQAAVGLDAIHTAGIVHRNIKAETVLVAQNGRVKIAESVIAAGTTAGDGDSTAGLVGELDNVPPEYLEHGDLTPRGDVYSLGMLAFEMITGRSPFRGKSVLEGMKLRLKAEAPSPKNFRSDCPDAVAELVNRALQREPSLRYQFARELAEDLKKVMN